MSTQSFLVEIGTEELPPGALRKLGDAFAEAILAGLAEQGLAHGDSRRFASPRRLALLVEGLEEQAPEKAVEVFGPPADRAKDADGNWTKAAEGFARKQGVEPDALAIVETDKGERLAYRANEPGARAADCLPVIVEASVRALPIPKRMRWGAKRTEFVRPVHWVVMLFGESVIDCELLGHRAGKTTRGHRFHSEGVITVSSPADYEQQLESAKVIANFERRRDMVEQQVTAQAESINATAVIDPELLDEVTALVEWPVALTGAFDEAFLTVPAEALISSMKEHQYYFHLVDGEGKLLPRFITVANLESRDPAQVIDGNERVIRPRLADAAFFFTQDKQSSLASRVASLDNIVFQQKLGSVGDKTRRLVALSEQLAPAVGADPANAARAAELSKTDLVTDMVGEFSDMQGIAGRYYALNDDEPPEVADALEQQYWPRFAGDKLPGNPVATCLALADRLDTLTGIFGIGQPPTGSKDPFALRRASLAVLRILVEGELALDLADCLQQAVACYPDNVLADDTVDQVMAYMIERFRAWYEDESIAPEVFRAVSARQLTVPLDIHRRVHAVNAFTRLPQAEALAAANKRVSNILEKQAADIRLSGVSDDLLTEAAECELSSGVRAKSGEVAALITAGDYTGTLATLADLQPAVDRFFDDVMVMADDEAVRNNRLSLLQDLRNLFLQVADISQLVISK